MYGTGTRSYNRSPEARELKRQREAATRKHEAEVAAGKFEPVVIGPMCVCGAFRFPHEPIEHTKCLNRSEFKSWEAWVNAGNPSYLWDGWAGLGTVIKFRRYES